MVHVSWEDRLMQLREDDGQPGGNTLGTDYRRLEREVGFREMPTKPI
jgi:hypothetical protein